MSTTDGEGVVRVVVGCPVRQALVDVSWQEMPSADSGPAEVAVAVTASTAHDLCQLWSVGTPCRHATTFSVRRAKMLRWKSDRLLDVKSVEL